MGKMCNLLSKVEAIDEGVARQVVGTGIPSMKIQQFVGRKSRQTQSLGNQVGILSQSNNKRDQLPETSVPKSERDQLLQWNNRDCVLYSHFYVVRPRKKMCEPKIRDMKKKPIRASIKKKNC